MEGIFFQQKASSNLSRIIKSFWQIDNKESVSITREKIIPDGYPELIFHFGDHYKSNLNINGTWQVQGLNLIAGQIKNHFFIENTGKSKVFGIKFQPWGLSVLFNIEMSDLTDRIIEIPNSILDTLISVKKLSVSSFSFVEKVAQIENWFIEFLSNLDSRNSIGQKAVELIIENKGKLELKNIQNEVGISERALQRYFRKKIGLSPKYYSRIIRFSHIFTFVQSERLDLSDIAFLSGFYDQSHFIKNFKEFTGDYPSNYSFFEKNLANFFLKK